MALQCSLHALRLRSIFGYLAVALGAGLLGAPATAAEKRVPTIDDLISLKRPSTPALSPDGRLVAYVVSEPNWTENAFESQIWLADVQKKTTIELTRSKKTNTAPTWSPDGQWLAFISDRDGSRQIYVMLPSAGEVRQVTQVETGVGQYHWSPDGRRIAFTATDPIPPRLKERPQKYGDFELFRHEYRMAHLWVVDVSGGSARRLTQGAEYTIQSFSWSPDGTRIAFEGQPTPSLSSSDDSDVYVYAFDSNSVRKIVDQPGPDRNPMWSPDGTQIVIETGVGRRNFFHEDVRLGIVPASGGTPRNATPAFDESAELTVWAPDGIYFTAWQKTAVHLFRVNPRTLAVERISSRQDGFHSFFTFSHDFKSVAFVEADPTNYPEVYISHVAGFAPQRLTDYAVQQNALQMATRELISWKSSDGATIEGALTKPANFDPSRRYPLLLVIHGGPGGVVSRPIPGYESPYYPTEIWAAKGALILEPNYRGSSGYGEGFRQRRVRTAGDGDYADIISGVDYLIGQGSVDKDRMGVMGWSFGGFITAYMLTHSDRFKAMSVGAGPTDWPVFDAWTELPQVTRVYLGASPSDDPEIYRKSSPITSIKRAKTPTLIQHCDLDPIVPIATAVELYQGLVDQEVPVRFYIYKGFGHNMTKPRSLRAAMTHNLNWFNHYIWGDPDDEGAQN